MNDSCYATFLAAVMIKTSYNVHVMHYMDVSP